LLSNIDRV
jgi:hypothetical protein